MISEEGAKKSFLDESPDIKLYLLKAGNKGWWVVMGSCEKSRVPAWDGWLSGGRGLVIGGIADPDLSPLARPLLTWGGGGQHFIFMKTYKLDNTTSPATLAAALQYPRQCESSV